MDRITNEPGGFQQTQTTRVKDPGPAQDANPPPPKKTEAQPQQPVNDNPSNSPFQHRGQKLNTVA